MEQHFVTFYSPGTFFAEQTTQTISSWDVGEAIKMSKEVVERYGAHPYGFRFSTRARQDDELDSKEVARSCMYYLGGKVESLEEIKKRGNPKENILISNIECNGWDKVVSSVEGWKWTQPLEDGDVILEV